MITLPVFRRRAAIVLLLGMLVQPVSALAQHGTSTATPSGQSAPPDPEADRDAAAPVLLGGEPVIWITTGAGPYTTQYRATRIGQRIESIIWRNALSTCG